MIDYKSFPGLAGVFLEDSYVLGISESSELLVFHLDAVLTPEHSAYHSPRPGEHYCEGDPFGGPVAMRLGVGGSWSTVERTRLG